VAPFPDIPREHQLSIFHLSHSIPINVSTIKESDVSTILETIVLLDSYEWNCKESREWFNW